MIDVRSLTSIVAEDSCIIYIKEDDNLTLNVHINRVESSGEGGGVLVLLKLPFPYLEINISRISGLMIKRM